MRPRERDQPRPNPASNTTRPTRATTTTAIAKPPGSNHPGPIRLLTLLAHPIPPSKVPPPAHRPPTDGQILPITALRTMALPVMGLLVTEPPVTGLPVMGLPIRGLPVIELRALGAPVTAPLRPVRPPIGPPPPMGQLAQDGMEPRATSIDRLLPAMRVVDRRHTVPMRTQRPLTPNPHPPNPIPATATRLTSVPPIPQPPTRPPPTRARDRVPKPLT